MTWRRYLNSYLEAGKLFYKKNALQLAAASAFYVVLAVVPLLLLLTRLIGVFIGDLDQVQQVVFTLGQEAFPEVEPEVLERIKNIVKGPLLGGASFTFVNFLILSVSSLSFFNSIWAGLYTLSEDKTLVSWTKHFKALVLIGVTVLIVLFLFSLQPALFLALKIVKYNALTDSIYANIPALQGVIDGLRSLNARSFLWLRSSFFQFSLFVVYFALVYRWFFNWRLKKREAFIASATFVVLLFLGKVFFGLYFNYLRVRFIQSYGDYYTVLVGALWIYMILAFFYFGICLVIELIRKVELESPAEEGDNVPYDSSSD
jgi:membrane protein